MTTTTSTLGQIEHRKYSHTHTHTECRSKKNTINIYLATASFRRWNIKIIFNKFFSSYWANFVDCFWQLNVPLDAVDCKQLQVAQIWFFLRNLISVCQFHDVLICFLVFFYYAFWRRGSQMKIQIDFVNIWNIIAFTELQKDDIHSIRNIWKRIFSSILTTTMICHYLSCCVFLLSDGWITEPKSHLSVFSFTGCMTLSVWFKSNTKLRLLLYVFFFFFLFATMDSICGRSFCFIFAVSEFFSTCLSSDSTDSLVFYLFRVFFSFGLSSNSPW